MIWEAVKRARVNSTRKKQEKSMVHSAKEKGQVNLGVCKLHKEKKKRLVVYSCQRLSKSKSRLLRLSPRGNDVEVQNGNCIIHSNDTSHLHNNNCLNIDHICCVKCHRYGDERNKHYARNEFNFRNPKQQLCRGHLIERVIPPIVLSSCFQNTL